jgi:ABC-2 type transport system permease protein
MNLFLMPMWFLSGALFPVQNASAALRWIMRLNPLTYGLGGLRRALYLGTPNAGPEGGLITNEITVAFIVSAAFAAIMLALGAAVARAPVAGDLQ